MRFAGEPGARTEGDLMRSLEEIDEALSRPRSREESRRAYLSSAAFVAWLGPWTQIDLESDFVALYRRFNEEMTLRRRLRR